MHFLITNDDGPPSAEHSPFILPFVATLKETFSGCRASVFIPSSQQSWISKAHQIKGDVSFSTLEVPLPPGAPPVSLEPWTLLTATPASCVNIALHHLLKGEAVDLVISGPNFGRNSSSTFITSSGTVGGAQEAAFCGQRAVSLSFAFFREDLFEEEDIWKACRISASIIKRLAAQWPEGVHVVNVNVPIFKNMPPQLEIYQTFIFQNSYESLFREEEGEGGSRVFRFRPNPPKIFAVHPAVGSDSWAVQSRHVSVTPMLTSFHETHAVELYPRKFPGVL